MDFASRALQFGFEATKLSLRIGVGAVKAVIGLVGGHAEPSTTSWEDQPAPARPTAAPARPAPANGAAPRPKPARRSTPPPPPPPTPAPALQPEEEPIHLNDEPELVGEFAEAGAEDGAHAEIHVDEPWAGYKRMRVGDIQARVAIASLAELAVVQMYESTTRGRKSILGAVERRTRELANEPG